MTTAKPGTRLAHKIPSLDGLRALSILIVMVSHSGLQDLVPGVFGVTVFFFISGFLITSLILDQYGRTGTIAIGSFYTRRFLRLIPPLFVFVAVNGLIWVAMGGRLHVLGVIAALAYMTNYFVIFMPQVMGGIGGQLWSLAVEEHFYLFFPLLMLVLLARPKLLVATLAALCVASLAVRIGVALAVPAMATEYNGVATECRIDAILYGALAALLLAGSDIHGLVERVTRPSVVVLALVVLLVTLLVRDPFFRSTWRYTIQSVALAPPILALTSTDRFTPVRALLNSQPLVLIGTLSYSLYLWHFTGFALGNLCAKQFGLPVMSGVLLGWTAAFAAAFLSFRFVERPFFALRRRFGSHVEVPDATALAVQGQA